MVVVVVVAVVVVVVGVVYCSVVKWGGVECSIMFLVYVVYL